ncbi:hypothetical protein NP493_452g01029 [Ridgeia piscesae]|uniref:Uncharacterized protein n=1 Tax=Ridgeia piscesae TaxID=27915 RepID=A0AAD9KZ45_RIDPI|nr:hypothetical protein NP493_452g01029 [Ridgeia piscesae]
MTLRSHLRLLQEYMQYPRFRELLTSPKQATHPLRSEPRKQMPQNPRNHPTANREAKHVWYLQQLFNQWYLYFVIFPVGDGGICYTIKLVVYLH